MTAMNFVLFKNSKIQYLCVQHYIKIHEIFLGGNDPATDKKLFLS